jgi:hypothetical protein
VEQFDNWSKTWDIIIPGKFVINRRKYQKHVPGELQVSKKIIKYLNYAGLFVYDKSSGSVAFFSTDGLGNLSVIKEYKNWSKTWDIIIPGKFSSSYYSDLFFYDKSSGSVAFFSTDGLGNLSVIKEYKNWSKTWDIITAGAFRNYYYLFSDLFFYDKSSGSVAFFSTDGLGNLSVIKEYKNWSKTWDIIITRELAFSPNYDCILLYDKSSGLGLIWSIYVPRPLQYQVKPTIIEKGQSVTVSVYFLDESIEYMFVLQQPNAGRKILWSSRASGTFKDSNTFHIANNEEFPIGKWKIHFYIKESGIYTKKHTEDLSIIPKILAND